MKRCDQNSDEKYNNRYIDYIGNIVLEINSVTSLDIPPISIFINW